MENFHNESEEREISYCLKIFARPMWTSSNRGGGDLSLILDTRSTIRTKGRKCKFDFHVRSTNIDFMKTSVSSEFLKILKSSHVIYQRVLEMEVLKVEKNECNLDSIKIFIEKVNLERNLKKESPKLFPDKKSSI